VEWWQLAQIKPNVVEIIKNAEKMAAEQHREIAATSLFNQTKVLKSFQEVKISDDCFYSNEGYGYHDYGRDKLEELFALVFKGEDAIVRPHFVSGTHAIFSCFRGLLRPGDRLVSVTGQPYDTLFRAISGNDSLLTEGNLHEWGISYGKLNLDEFDELEKCICYEMLQEPTRLVFIQRSKGYNPYRSALTVKEIKNLIQKIRSFNSEVIIFVDNCYGEFVEKNEPLEAGADLIAGSLIKNPGGGLAPTGGYIVGKKKYIDKVSHAISAPGLGKELGAFVYNKRLFFQGIFMAPHLAGEALKGMVTIAAALEAKGFEVEPRFDAKRGDIVQAVRLKNKTELEKICLAVQSSSPVNSHLIPVAGATAGYTDPVFMAAGTFVQGASGEFSADGPLREPFTVYIQGGLTYHHVILGLASILEAILD
jgi:cystathionine beta-lyase family protein involved in aluminum resistance